MPDQPSCVLLDAAVALPRVRVPGRGGALVATAQHDEDVITLGAEAALQVRDRHDVRPAALLLASVSAPFAEGGNAQVLAEVLALTHDDLLVLELSGSAAAAGGALATAAALAASGTAPVMVVAADVRRDDRHRALGDAAVCLLIGPADQAGAAEVTHVSSRAELVRDEWRMDGGATQRADSSFAKAVAGAPAPRDGVAQLLATTVLGPPVDRVGVAGCAAFPLSLLLALEGADGDVVVSASGVTHRFHVSAGRDAARTSEAARAVVAGGVEGPDPGRVRTDGFDPYASQPRSWRDRAQDLRLQGQRDPATGEVLFPPVPAASAGDLQPVRLARTGRVLTHTRDHIFPQGAPLSMAVVQLDGGGRFYGQVVDGLPVAIDDPVTLVLRRLHDGGGVPQWFWKVRPDGHAQDRPDAVQPAVATRV